MLQKKKHLSCYREREGYIWERESTSYETEKPITTSPLEEGTNSTYLSSKPAKATEEFLTMSREAEVGGVLKIYEWGVENNGSSKRNQKPKPLRNEHLTHNDCFVWQIDVPYPDGFLSSSTESNPKENGIKKIILEPNGNGLAFTTKPQDEWSPLERIPT